MNNVRVGLQNTWYDNKLDNHFVVTSYEKDEKVLRELETNGTLSNDRDGINYSISNLEPNPTINALKMQAPKSPLEQANAEKLAKLESERLESEKEFLKAQARERTQSRIKKEIRTRARQCRKY
ncbi:conserved hypothetical mosaic CUP0956/HP1116/jhp1044-like protein [Helicobacter pylori F16]|nr:conserved hypothetical mosaic CUP0956/HP1116/jhp1044-like protein [Helicobacter pylori F16]